MKKNENADGSSSPSLASPKGQWLGRLMTTVGPLLGLALVIAVFGITDRVKAGPDTFLSMGNLRTIVVQVAPLAVASLGMTLVIISGGIDLSAGTAMALSTTVLAYCLDHGHSAIFSIIACLLTGILAGVVNGTLISALRVVPFIITLGTMTIYEGLAKILADEKTIRPGLETIPDWLKGIVDITPDSAWIVENKVPNFAPGVWLAIVLAIIVVCLLRYSVFGRYVFALGSNESTARLCGINVFLCKIAIYSLSGLFVGIAGVYGFAKMQMGDPTAGMGFELKIIAAVVIGGGSLAGGQGSVLGTISGALIMIVIASGCVLLELPAPIQDILIGVIIVGAVTIDQLRRRRQMR